MQCCFSTDNRAKRVSRRLARQSDNPFGIVVARHAQLCKIYSADLISASLIVLLLHRRQASKDLSLIICACSCVAHMIGKNCVNSYCLFCVSEGADNRQRQWSK